MNNRPQDLLSHETILWFRLRFINRAIFLSHKVTVPRSQTWSLWIVPLDLKAHLWAAFLSVEFLIHAFSSICIFLVWRICSKGSSGHQWTSVDRPCRPCFCLTKFWHARNPIPQSIRLENCSRAAQILDHWVTSSLAHGADYRRAQTNLCYDTDTFPTTAHISRKYGMLWGNCQYWPLRSNDPETREGSFSSSDRDQKKTSNDATGCLRLFKLTWLNDATGCLRLFKLTWLKSCLKLIHDLNLFYSLDPQHPGYQTYIFVYICMCSVKNVGAWMRVWVRRCVDVWVWCIHIHTCMDACEYACLYSCMLECMYVCACVRMFCVCLSHP